MWSKRVITALLCLCAAGSLCARPEDKPRLVVNMVVSQMRSADIDLYADGFSQSGLGYFLSSGLVMRQGRYGFMQTVTPAGLATLTTGVNPDMHGVVSERWTDPVTGSSVSLIDDSSARGLDCSEGQGRYSQANIVMPTVGDNLLECSPDSKVVTVALDPLSAVAMGGRSSRVYWFDTGNGNFVSSSAYMDRLPDWTVRYNAMRFPLSYATDTWTLFRSKDKYRNTRYSVFDMRNPGNRQRIAVPALPRSESKIDYGALLRSPFGNSIVAEFAAQAVAGESLGTDAGTDILNICFDASRYICQRYGPESMETEDMFYRLDADIAALIKNITSVVPIEHVLFVLTSDHGCSSSYDISPSERERFNADQFKVIMNSFLGVQFGPGDWVCDYTDRQLYLNHNLIYNNRLSLEEVQKRAAAFALQFRGVAHVLTATALTGGYFGDSWGRMMQNGYFPRRGGDLVINLMPDWIQVTEGARSLSGSMYDYDTRVPLLMLGWKIPALSSDRAFDMTALAPTLARIMQINCPTASSGLTIQETDNL